MIGNDGKKESGAPWHHTTVILQSDIYRQALERGIDISDACNRALASLTGTEYRQKRREEVPPRHPLSSPGTVPPCTFPGSQKKPRCRRCLRSSTRMTRLHRPGSCRQKSGRSKKAPAEIPRRQCLHLTS